MGTLCDTRCGTSQEHGVDYVETYAPVAATDSQRVLLSRIAAEDLHANQLDIEASFEHQDVFYIQLPERVVYSQDTTRGLHCGRLRKPLYGLKQAAYELHSRLTRVLIDAAYVFSTADPCVFYRGSGNDFLIATMHIDDMLVAVADAVMYDHLRNALRTCFPIKHLG